MKHAILILAHKELEHICRIVEYFKKSCEIFIHLDKKGCYDPVILNKLYSYRQVKLILQEYEVNWGGTSVLESELHLLQTAFKQSKADYFHLISGQDYPIRPLNSFLDFFSKNNGKEYLRYVHLPHPKWENNTFKRLQYYYPYDNAADKKYPRQWVREQVGIQCKKGIKRPIPDEFDHLYGSSQWFSITRKAVSTLLEYTENSPALYKQMWMTFAPEECYVATVLVNLLGTENIVQSNLRFIRWKYENGNNPANLGKEHFHYLLEEECFFARKIEPHCSAMLLPLIDKYLHHDAKIESCKTGGWKYDGFLKYSYEKKFCEFVTQLWWDVNLKNAIDIGCGAGYYVAQWRSKGLSFAGYDANPYTNKLSGFLLPENDKPCGTADLTDELDIKEPFDLVVCKDVLPYIPKELEMMAIKNLARLSSRFILLSWNVPKGTDIPVHRHLSEENIVIQFEQENFIIENFMTARMRVILNRKDCCLFIKRGLQLLTI